MKKIIISFVCILLCFMSINVVYGATNTSTYNYYDNLDINDRKTINVVVGCKVGAYEIALFDYCDYNFEYSVSNTNIATVDKDGNITGKSVGTTTLTVKMTMDKKVSNKQFTIKVYNSGNIDNSYNVYESDDIYFESYAKVSINGMDENSYIKVTYDNSKISYSEYVLEDSIKKGYIEFYVEKSTTVTLIVDGKTYNLTFNLINVDLSLNNIISNKIYSLVTYNGKSDNITLKLNNTKKNAYKYTSDNTKIATVSNTGVITGKGTLGRTYVKVYLDKDNYVNILVENTYKKAYQAVYNGFKDLLYGYNNKRIKYSQGKRMELGYRDCSSFVSRCYWDTKLGRSLYNIGGLSYRGALTAADQAKWLNNHGKRIAYGEVSTSKLLPGDTIYNSGGSNGRYRNINHAILYVGNGYVISTSGPKSDTLMLRSYNYGNIVFIGRPLKSTPNTLTINKSSITLGNKESYTLKITKNTKKSISYKSSNSKIATVSSKGKITAKKKGTTYITVSNGTNSKKCKVVVKNAPTSIKLNAKSKTLSRGKTFSIKVTLSSGSASYKKTYKSSNSKVASVSSSGKITAKKKGSATITVSTYNNKKAKIKIKVKDILNFRVVD